MMKGGLIVNKTHKLLVLHRQHCHTCHLSSTQRKHSSVPQETHNIMEDRDMPQGNSKTYKQIMRIKEITKIKKKKSYSETCLGGWKSISAIE